MTPQHRARLLAEAQQLAELEATTWFVWRRNRSGADLGYRIVQAGSSTEALRRVRNSTKAEPVLSTAAWLRLYERVGLTPAS